MKTIYKNLVSVILCFLIFSPVQAFAEDLKYSISLTDTATVYSDGFKGPVQSITSYTKSANPDKQDIPPQKASYREYDQAGLLQYYIKYDLGKAKTYFSYTDGKLSEIGEFDNLSETRKPILKYQYSKPSKDIELVNVVLVSPSGDQQNIVSRQYAKMQNGLLIEKGIIDSTGTPFEIYSYEYLPENEMKITITKLQYKVTTIETYATDRTYRMIEKFRMGRMKDPFHEAHIEKFSYDDNLNLVESEVQGYRNNEPNIHDKDRRTYEIFDVDDYGNWIKRRLGSWYEYEMQEFSYYK